MFAPTASFLPKRLTPGAPTHVHAEPNSNQCNMEILPMAKKAKIKIGALATSPITVEEDAIILLPAAGTTCEDTYRTAQPTEITNSRTQKDRGIEIDCRRRRTPKRKVKANR